MPSTEEQVKGVILKHQGSARKQQMARELKLGLDYIDLICRDLERKGEIIFSDGFHFLTTSKPPKKSGNEPHPNIPKPEGRRKPKKDKIKIARALKKRPQKKSTQNPMLKKKREGKKRRGYKTIQFQAKFPFLKLVFIPYTRNRVATA